MFISCQVILATEMWAPFGSLVIRSLICIIVITLLLGQAWAVELGSRLCLILLGCRTYHRLVHPWWTHKPGITLLSPGLRQTYSSASGVASGGPLVLYVLF